MPDPVEFNALDAALTSLRSDEERAAFEQILAELREGKSQTLETLRSAVYERTPVDIVTFIEHPDYLDKQNEVWPILMDELVKFFHEGDKYLGILRGSLGWGKTSFADIALAYILYQLSCLRNPSSAYGLLANDTVALICVSVSKYQAKRVMFKRLRQLMKKSPYFTDVFPPQDMEAQEELRFPKSVWLAPVSSTEQGVIGENVFGGVMDEANFQPVVQDSKLRRGKGQVYDHAQVIFDALYRRMKSRFPGLPGKFMIVSSEQYPDDFVDRTCKKFRDDPGVQIMHYSMWETRPKTAYAGPTFKVEIGTDIRPTRILTGSETDVVGEVMEVPAEYEKDFRDDPDGATRDIAGRSTLALIPFITDRQSIQDALDKTRLHPMTNTKTTLQDGVKWIWERLATRMPDDDEGHEVWQPKWFPERPRFVHIDLGLTNDRAGVAMGCCCGVDTQVRKVESEDGKIELLPERVPIVWYDFLLSVEAPPFGQIQFSDIRAVLYALVKHGFRLQKVSYDSFGSISEIQELMRKGYDVEKLSVDTSMDPYLYFRSALQERRAKYYEHPILLKEAVQLEHNKIRKKVDHPSYAGGSKDLADAAAGVAHWVHQLGMSSPPVVTKGLSVNAQQDSPVEAKPDCLQKGCKEKAEVRGYCRKHWEALQEAERTRLTHDERSREEQIWSMDGGDVHGL